VDPAACGQQLSAASPPSQDGVHGEERRAWEGAAVRG
jgi:hypothetical protein